MNDDIKKFLNYLIANDNEGYLELDSYYHLVEIINFDIRVEQRTKTLRIHNVFYLTPNKCFKNNKYICSIKK